MLQANDPQVNRLAAEALAAAGPQLAAALPEVGRPALVQALSGGISSAGGALAAIGPAFSAALLRPPADWAALQQQLQSAVAGVELAIDAAGRAQVRDNVQEVEQPGAGPAVLRITATDDTVVERNQQRVRRPDEPGAPAAPGDPQHPHTLLAATIARLQIRELQAAQYSIDVPPHITVERDALCAEVERLRALVGRGVRGAP